MLNMVKRSKLMLVLASLMLSAGAAHARLGESNFAHGILGFSQSALNFGGDFEHRVDSLGYGAYFLYSSEKDTDNVKKHQIMTFGGMMVAHVLDDSRWDITIAPGVGLNMYKGIKSDVPRDGDETAFGPMVKFGLNLKISPTVTAGLDHMIITNWMSEKVPATMEFTNASVGFAF